MSQLVGKKVLGKLLPKEYMADKTEYVITLTGVQVEALYGLLKTPRLVVHLDGGLVQGVVSDIEGIAFKVIDHDIEGSPDTQNIDDEKVIITLDDQAEKNPDHVEEVFAARSKFLEG